MLKSSQQIIIPRRKALFILVFLGLIVSCFLGGIKKLVLAQEENPVVTAATDSAQSEEEQNKNQKKVDVLRKAAEEIVKAEQSSASGELQEKRAFCGELKSKSSPEGTLILTTREGDKTVSFNDETVFLNTFRKKIKIEDIESGSFLIAMGYSNRLTPGKLAAKRIVEQKSPSPLTRQSFSGKITDISSDEKIFSLLPFKDKKVAEVLFDKTTICKKKGKGKKIETGRFEDIKKNDIVVLVGKKDPKNNKITATLVYIFSSAAVSPSPSLSPSP